MLRPRCAERRPTMIFLVITDFQLVCEKPETEERFESQDVRPHNVALPVSVPAMALRGLLRNHGTRPLRLEADACPGVWLAM